MEIKKVEKRLLHFNQRIEEELIEGRGSKEIFDAGLFSRNNSYVYFLVTI